MTTLLCYPLGKTATVYTVINGVTQIGSYAFAGNKVLNTINLSNTVTKILDSAFYNVSITTISIPLSVTTIGYEAFNNSKNLTTVNYGGTSSDKDSISIGSSNDPLLNATWNCHVHSYTTYVGQGRESSNHFDIYKCSCGKQTSTNFVSHTFVDQSAGYDDDYHWSAFKKCSVCGYENKVRYSHTFKNTYEKYDTTQHKKIVSGCSDNCGYSSSTTTYENHFSDPCSLCGYDSSGCQHTNTRTNYNWLGDWDNTGNYDQHLKQVICADCSTSDYYEVLSEDPENCTFENGVCIYCGHTQGATSASRQPIDMEVEPTYYSSNSKMVETKNFTPVFYNKKGELLKT